MGRHRGAGSGGAGAVRLAVLVLIWLAGIVAGLFALLAAAAGHTTCSSKSTALACRSAGMQLGAALAVAVVVVVTVITVTSYGKQRAWVARSGLIGLLLLAALFFAARALLNTA